MAFHRLTHRLGTRARKRSALLRNFAQSIGLVYFGAMHQHNDEYDAIRGFTASLTHSDAHYAVGTYNGFNIRLVDRSDRIKAPTGHTHSHQWVIFEFDLELADVPHLFFIPTGSTEGSYHQLFAAQPHLQPINSLLSNHSPEFHGRYQLLARATHLHKIEELFNSPLIAGIGARFWPHAIELHHSKMYVYLPSAALSKAMLESTLASSLWLATTPSPRE